MANFKGSHKIILSLVVGFVVGLLLGWLLFSEPEGVVEEVIENETESQVLSEEDIPELGESGVEGDRSIFVEDQLIEVKDQPAGSDVFISRVALKKSGWVVVHEEKDGVRGNILGARRFDAGVFQGFVPLVLQTSAGERYYATLWHDDGDRQFNYKVDMFTTDNVGEIISMRFEVY